MKDFVFSNEFFQGIDAQVYTCGLEACEPGHSYGPAVRSGFLIHYVIAGKGVYQTADKTYHLEAGDAFLIKPGELVFYAADRKEPWAYTWIGFQGVKVERYLNRTSLLEHPVFHCRGNQDIFSCHERMYEANRLEENKDLLMSSILYEYLFHLASAFPRNRLSADERNAAYVEETLKYIESGYARKIEVGDIAEQLNIDRSYLHRLFRRAVGMSVQDYLLDFRIKRASELLARTDYHIASIARSVGYDDPLYFSRLFRKKRGMSPSEYRAGKGRVE